MPALYQLGWTMSSTAAALACTGPAKPQLQAKQGVCRVEKVSKSSSEEVERVAVKETRPPAGEGLGKTSLRSIQQEANITQDPALAILDSVPVCHGKFLPEEGQPDASAYLVMG